MNFGQAIEALKLGSKVAREGWNGKGMFIYLVRGSLVNELRGEAATHVGQPKEGDAQVINSHIEMKAADGSIVVGWFASQTDILAEDWVIVLDGGKNETDERWKSAIENARFMLEEYKKIPNGIFGAMNIANIIARYDSGERTKELLEELEGIE
jgi:hypothetical protein